MAEQARVPYSQAAIAVIVPALFHFLALVIAVEIEARKQGLGAKAKAGTPTDTITRADWAQLKAKVIEGGVAIGLLAGTGLGTKTGSDLNMLVSGNLIWALVLTMIAALILSMGMPTLPAYATIITIMGVFGPDV